MLVWTYAWTLTIIDRNKRTTTGSDEYGDEAGAPVASYRVPGAIASSKSIHVAEQVQGDIAADRFALVRIRHFVVSEIRLSDKFKTITTPIPDKASPSGRTAKIVAAHYKGKNNDPQKRI